VGQAPEKKLTIQCTHCGHTNAFDQPHGYHAGFSDLGFLYNEAGDRTLVWSVYDPVFVQVVGDTNPWDWSPSARARFESILPPSPTGSAWGADFPGRCLNCHEAILEPMHKYIWFGIYPGSVVLTGSPGDLRSICDAPA
jgi:hypothetical protein